MLKTLEHLQNEQYEWSKKKFGPQDSVLPLLGVVEEIGELCHAVLKRRQGIHTGEYLVEEQDAIGDIVIFLMDYCNRRGFNLMHIVRHTWDQVSSRQFAVQRDDGTWAYANREEEDLDG